MSLKKGESPLDGPDGQSCGSAPGAELERSLAAAGFSVVRVFGDWDHRPVEPDSPELIFVAARR